MPDRRKFDLPSGGWWELEMDPTHGQIEDIRTQALKAAGLFGADATLSDAAVEGIVHSGRINMIVLTTAWSFDESMPVTGDSLRLRSGRDTACIADVIEEHIGPLLEDPTTRLRRKRSASLSRSGSGGSPENSQT